MSEKYQVFHIVPLRDTFLYLSRWSKKRGPPQTLVTLFGIVADELRIEPRYNIAPTQPGAIVRGVLHGERSLEPARWGLVPRWAKDVKIGARMINARSETAAEKPAFRDAFRRRRCLIPASGFYEWQRLGSGRKQPYYIYAAERSPLALAGLWETWNDPQGDRPLTTFTVLTTAANATVSRLHDRMPVIIPELHFSDWLGDDQPIDRLALLLAPADDRLLTMHPVSPRVNSPAHDDASLIEPQQPAEQPSSTGESQSQAHDRLFD